MKQVMSFTIDHTIKEQLEQLARDSKTTVSKYMAQVLTYHVQEELSSGIETPKVNIDDSLVELSAEEEGEFLRALKHQPNLTKIDYLKWKLSTQ